MDSYIFCGSDRALLLGGEGGCSGVVEWWCRRTGLPTLLAEADIPVRNLSVIITIRRNFDPALPASQLMELDFRDSDTFVGGGIARQPGIPLKNQKLVQDTPLIGASARAVGNSFLFALSTSENDVEANRNLLAKRLWMDIAITYSIGKADDHRARKERWRCFYISLVGDRIRTIT